MDILKQRQEQVAASILEQKTLTDNLDEASATVLLDWSLAQVKMIVAQTETLDDVAAEAAMSDQLKALRPFIRILNRQIAHFYKVDETSLVKHWMLN